MKEKNMFETLMRGSVTFMLLALVCLGISIFYPPAIIITALSAICMLIMLGLSTFFLI